MAVLVLDKRKRPLMPCSEKRARLLLERGRAVVVRRYPFTIRLRDRIGGATQDIRIKLDPGSKTTGMALVADADGNKPTKVLALFELQHRGQQISEKLPARRAFRRRCRGALQGINVRHCTLVHRSDGYSYRGSRLLPTDKSEGIWRGKIR